MNNTPARSIPSLVIGLVLIAVGLAVFAIRLTHAGPYAMPMGAAFYGSLVLIISGGYLAWSGSFGILGWIVLTVSTPALLPSLYSIMAESEETISLYAKDASGNTVDLRLWIVDREDGAWVGMGRDKASANRLSGADLQMLRAGRISCVTPVLHVDGETTRAIHKMKVDKYSVAQMAGAIGMYPLEATEATVALRLDPCKLD